MYQGFSSSQRNLPGSSPQGAFLGIFLFIIKFNGAALRPHVPRLIPCKKVLSKCKEIVCQKHPKQSHAIYVDDLGEAEAIDLTKQLISDPVQRQFPLNYYESSQHILPPENSLLQNQLLKVEQFSINNQLKINEKKSKIIVFNTSRKYSFPPEYSFSNGEILEVVKSTSLLGVTISSDLNWEANTSNIFKKAMSRMWLLRRLKILIWNLI